MHFNVHWIGHFLHISNCCEREQLFSSHTSDPRIAINENCLRDRVITVNWYCETFEMNDLFPMWGLSRTLAAWENVSILCVSVEIYCFQVNFGDEVFFLFFVPAGHCLQIARTLLLLTTSTGRDSSGVERMTSNHKAAGSNPARGFSAQYLGSLLFIDIIGMKIIIIFVLHSLLSWKLRKQILEPIFPCSRLIEAQHQRCTIMCSILQYCFALKTGW